MAALMIERGRELASLTSLRCGGAVEAFAEVRCRDELREALAVACQEKLPVAVIGAGTNLLAPDGRLRAMVLKLGGEFSAMRREGDRASPGGAVRLSRAARKLAHEGYSGLEFAAGIPGTVGGAVAMNAGYGGRCIADCLESALLLDRNGGVATVPADEMEFSYRTSRIRRTGEIVLGVVVRLAAADPAVLREQIKEQDAHRALTQPLTGQNCGSVFKNPPGDAAGRLIDRAGLKGKRVGGAEVSTVHANFIETRPGARSADVRELIERCAYEVRARFGVELEREVQYLEDCLFDLEALT